MPTSKQLISTLRRELTKHADPEVKEVAAPVAKKRK
jgi:hypothetical protein